jgi:site-specific DNA-methyltransferase (cytosine-N4-specific)
MSAKHAADAVAEKLRLTAEQRSATVTYGGAAERKANCFDRAVRWTRQTAVLSGLILDGRRSAWELAEKGYQTLKMAKPGISVLVAHTDDGSVLWAEARTAMGFIDRGSQQLAFFSPPYPLVKQREYDKGAWAPDRYLDTLHAHVSDIKPLLVDNGSLVINLADVYQPGSPTLMAYQEQFVVNMVQMGWHLCGKQVWHNPQKPKTTPYVTMTRERIAGGVENFFWFSPSAHPKADNRRVLVPYSEGFKAKLANGGELRGGGNRGARQTAAGLRFRTDNGGAIPQNIIVEPHEASNSAYLRNCRQQGLPFHPARMPTKLARFWVQFTTDPGDGVFDPFGGSLTTAAVCQELGRKFITSEKCLDYIKGGLFRLKEAPGLQDLTHSLVD